MQVQVVFFKRFTVFNLLGVPIGAGVSETIAGYNPCELRRRIKRDSLAVVITH